MRNFRLRTRFIILFAGIMAASLVLYVVWGNYSQHIQAEREMREKAYVLSQQLDSVWEFMAINQDRINHDKNGEYNFKGLHCSLVGKSIGKLFSIKTDYTIRYVNHNPRNKDDIPDAFESASLDRFKTDRELKEIFDITTFKDKMSFRYVVPMVIDPSCMECHGEPAGVLDVTGYPKEGWKIGDLAGVLSIVMPIELYRQNSKENLIREAAFFCIAMLVFILITYYATARLVTKPLNKLTSVMARITGGDLNTGLDPDNIKAEGEIKELTDHFNMMIDELRNVYKDLENKVDLRTKDLAKANDILEAQQKQLEVINKRLLEDNKYKSDFLAIMSHELRTPLTSSVAFTDVLEKISGGTERERRIINEIKTNNQTLLSLINNILDMARIEAGKAELLLEPVDFVDVINAVEKVIKPLADKKELTLITDVDRTVPLIKGDREKLRRIVENLLSNAVKFTRAGGHVRVWVKFDDVTQEITINVEDNGIGIAPEEQSLVFEKFVQGDSSIHRPYSGSGLGLALARELAELHGGRITLESELGKGSIFTVTIPVEIYGGTDEDYAG